MKNNSADISMEFKCLSGKKFNGNQVLILPKSKKLDFKNKLSVVAWFKSEKPSVEKLQALVAKWQPLTTFNTFDAYDAGNTDGMDTGGYLGCLRLNFAAVGCDNGDGRSDI